MLLTLNYKTILKNYKTIWVILAEVGIDWVHLLKYISFMEQHITTGNNRFLEFVKQIWTRLPHLCYQEHQNIV